MSDDSKGVRAKLTTYKTVLYGLVILGAGFGAMWLSNISWFTRHSALQTTVNQLGGLLITIGGLAILWDLRGKRDIMEEVLEKVRIESDVSTAGIDRVTMKYLDGINWDDLFRNARNISVFISYGSSWRKYNWTRLENFAATKGNRLRLFLPDPDDDMTMSVLAKRYDYSPDKVRTAVREAAEEFAKLGISSEADIRIYYRAGDPTFTCYHFDDKVLVTFYSNKRARGDVPTILVGQGTLRDFFVQELAAIENQSRSVPLDGLVGGK
ncbi:hypothetical protein A5659_10030 [Mycobacterium sp. 1165196.3]|uniref:hypothetical protein n=1 Tax=Mycobacterium sp. 1165196.3 TaxID=1834071 RepID=UPI0007FE033D|nr:hypothetical protein [Mycobacterium sp. 1165196.3]OBK41542.1 hypothetical protein A5659_10030 [Mycobacterium sp. 1165196.3]